MTQQTRAPVDQFFHYDLRRPPNEWWKQPLRLVVAISTLSVVVIALMSEEPQIALIGGLVTLFAGLFGIEALSRHHNTVHRNRREQEFRRLAAATRSIQATDVIRAFLRSSERAQLDPSSLRTLEQRFVLDRERDLFEDESVEDRIGELQNKSIRLISRDGFRPPRLRRVNWTQSDGSKRREIFFNPIRLISIFLTEEELVVCDTGIDSSTGDLREEILRIMLCDIVTICFNSERSKLELPAAAQEALAADSDLSAYACIEEKTSSFSVSTRDGNTRAFPIKSQILVGDHDRSLDRTIVRTPDEIAIDRMVNELSRLVRPSSRMTRSA